MSGSKYRSPFQDRLRIGPRHERRRQKLYVLAILKDIATIDLVLEVGDPQTLCAAALFSFQGANLSYRVSRTRILSTAFAPGG